VNERKPPLAVGGAPPRKNLATTHTPMPRQPNSPWTVVRGGLVSAARRRARASHLLPLLPVTCHAACHFRFFAVCTYGYESRCYLLPLSCAGARFTKAVHFQGAAQQQTFVRGPDRDNGKYSRAAGERARHGKLDRLQQSKLARPPPPCVP
jgi:hypothetical protein